MNENLSAYLQATDSMDCVHPDVVNFAHEHTKGAKTPKEQAVKLYYAVRDRIWYDPYAIELSPAGIRASTTVRNGRGWCVPKALLLTACCRTLDIPAKIGFADVKNHLSTERMRALMKTDIFVWHGYTSIYLDGKWVKATPAFNIELCERFRLKTLDFDGDTDSLYQPFDLEGNRHMEYVREHGVFADVPLAEIIADFQRYYPLLFKLKEGNFEQDILHETQNSQAGIL